jgi:hypothetical protein
MLQYEQHVTASDDTGIEGLVDAQEAAKLPLV